MAGAYITGHRNVRPRAKRRIWVLRSFERVDLLDGGERSRERLVDLRRGGDGPWRELGP